MKILGLELTKANKGQLERKSITDFPSLVGFTEYLASAGQFDLSLVRMTELYSTVMPFFNAIDIRARSFSEVRPMVSEVGDESEFITDHQVLKLLRKPNDAQSGAEFGYDISSLFDIHGNAFVIATGQVDKPPLELIPVPAFRVTMLSTSPELGWLNVPSQIRVNSDRFSSLLFFAESTQSGVRYYTKSRDKELLHIKGFNPWMNSNNFWGMSRANPLLKELEQYQEGNVNNLSLLLRGARPSMVWQNARDTALTSEQREFLEEAAKKYSGSKNAGGVPILDGIEAKGVATNNREMEFKELQRDMYNRIAVAYDIPLPLLSNDAASYNNYRTAQVALWDNAVIPQIQRIYGSLTDFLMPRYGDDPTEVQLTYNVASIEPLKQRQVEIIREQNEINVNTVNEIRHLLGNDPVAEGNVIYAPMTMSPLGEGMMQGNSASGGGGGRPSEDDMDDEQRAFASTRLAGYLRELKTEDGGHRYTEEEINEKVFKEYGV